MDRPLSSDQGVITPHARRNLLFIMIKGYIANQHRGQVSPFTCEVRVRVYKENQ